jgi:4-amino-4-deoxy-L-arabinose transferase-like glycosyltransferase
MEHTGLNEQSANRFMAILLPAFFAMAIIFSICIPTWQNSDEPFHYYYVKYLLRDHRLPTRDETYQAAHPPLYYLMATAWTEPFKNRGPDFMDKWIRIMSALMGTATVYFLYRIGRDCFGSAWTGAAMAVFAAVNPMFVCASSVLNNDIGVIFSTTVALFLITFLLNKKGGSPRTALICGIAAGVCCLFKISANFLPLFFVFIYLFHPTNRGRGFVRLSREIFIFFVAFAAVCAWWYIRGYFIIGDKLVYNFDKAYPPNPLYVPSNFFWFAKNIMLSLWLPNDYLRGEPSNLPLAMKLFYFGLSGIIIFLVGLCVFKYCKKLAPIQKHLVSGFLFCLILFLLQQVVLNMKLPNAQARYMFPMYCALALVIVIPLKEAAGQRFPKAVIIAAAIGMIFNLIWAFALLLPCPGPSFIIL